MVFPFIVSILFLSLPVAEAQIVITNINSITDTVRVGETADVHMYISNLSSMKLTIAEARLTFSKDGQDVSAYYQVRPSQNNPTEIGPNQTNVALSFTVTVSPLASTGSVKIDGFVRAVNNIIENGSFETDSGQPPPTEVWHWCAWPNPDAYRSYSVDYNEYSHGRRSYRITFTNAPNNTWGTTSTAGNPGGGVVSSLLYPVSPNTTYCIEVSFKDNIDGVRRCVVFEQYKDNTFPIGEENNHKAADDTYFYPAHADNWVNLREEVYTTAITYYCRVWVGMYTVIPGPTSGSIWFDNVRLYKKGEEYSDSAADNPKWWTVKGDDIPPPAPQLYSPTNGTTITGLPINFDWSDVDDSNTGGSNPCSYHLQVDDNIDFSSPEIDESDLTDSNYTTKIILKNGRYFWHVYSIDSKGNRSMSDNFSFVLNAPDVWPPPKPKLNEPANNVEITELPINFSWSAVSDEETGGNDPCSYDLQVDDDESFNNPEFNLTGIQATSVRVDYLPRSAVYYWRVRAKDTKNNFSDWTSHRIFTLKLPDRKPPPVPQLIAPSNGSSTSDALPTFVWNLVQDEESNPCTYKLQVDNDINFSSPEINVSDIPVNNYTPYVRLNDKDIDYYWRVKAVDAVGNESDWSEVWKLHIYEDKTPPGNVVDLQAFPGPEKGCNAGSIELRWTSPGDDGDAGGPIKSGYCRIQVSVSSSVVWSLEDAQFEVPIIYAAAQSQQSYLLKGLESGVTYYIKIWIGDDARNWSGESNLASSWAQYDTIPPNAINDLTALRHPDYANVVTLSWTSPGDDGSEGNFYGWFKIQYAENIEELGLRRDAQVAIFAYNLPPGTKQSYTFYDLSGDKYYFALWAGDEGGNWSKISNMAAIGDTVKRDTIPPGKIEDLKCEYSFYNINLTWTVPGNDGNNGNFSFCIYRIQYSTMSDIVWDVEKTAMVFSKRNVSAHSKDIYTLSALTEDNTYYFRLWIADEAINWSEPSNLASVYIPLVVELPDTEAPAKITDLSASYVKDEPDTILLTWSTPGDDGTVGVLRPRSKYKIQFSTFSGTPWSAENAQVSISTFGISVGEQVRHKLKGLVSGVTYYFAIWAFDEQNNSSQVSNIASAYAIDNIPPAKINEIEYMLSSTTGQVCLIFKFTGDNYNDGVLPEGEFYVQYSTYVYNITWSTSMAQVVISTSNVAPQEKQYIWISDLPVEREYYFRIWVRDEQHNFSPPSQMLNIYLPEPESIPPAKITDLRVAEVGCDYVLLSWTSTGDDNYSGNIRGKYYIKFSTLQEINDATWEKTKECIVFSTFTNPGKIEYFKLFLPSEMTTYYFALRLSDEQDNLSEVSNCVFARTAICDVIPPELRVTYAPPALINIYGDKIVVDAMIRDERKLAKVEMKYCINDDENTWFSPEMKIKGNNLYRFEILPDNILPSTKKIKYYIYAFDEVNYTYFGTREKPMEIKFNKVSEFTDNKGILEVSDGNPDDGSTRLELLPGAVDVNRITIEQVDVEQAVAAYRILPKDAVLRIPAKLSLLYFDLDNNGIVDRTGYYESDLVVCLLNEKENKWEVVGGEIEPSKNTISVKITKFGTYAVFDSTKIKRSSIPLSAQLMDKMFITPYNPIINFGYDVEEVRIYAVSGKPIITLSKENDTQNILWRATTAEGDFVESGFYICQVKTKAGKIKYFSIVVAK